MTWNKLDRNSPPFFRVIYVNWKDQEDKWHGAFHFNMGKLSEEMPDAKDIYWVLAEGLIIDINRPDAFQGDLH